MNFENLSSTSLKNIDVMNTTTTNVKHGDITNIKKNNFETSDGNDTVTFAEEISHTSSTINFKNQGVEQIDDHMNTNAVKNVTNDIVPVNNEHNVINKENKSTEEIGLSLDGNLEEDRTTSPIHVVSTTSCNDNEYDKNTKNFYKTVDNVEKNKDTINNNEKGNDNGNNDVVPLTRISSQGESKPSQTIEQWLFQENQMVYPVWIGNLPNDTNIRELRRYVESKVGNVLISVHISMKQTGNVDDKISTHQYAFINMPTAEKQILCVTLLDNKTFKGEKLIVRPKRPSRFPSHTYVGNTPISSQFRHFCDCIVPEILNNPSINLNVQSVRKILANNQISLEHLPNRVWGIQCTLIPQCHRQYCSFFHNHNEKELGRIISILAAQNCGKNNNSNIASTPTSGIEDNETIGNCDENSNDINQNNEENIQNGENEESTKIMGDINDISPNIICFNNADNENILQNDPLQLNESQSTNLRTMEEKEKNIVSNTNNGKQYYSEHTLLVQGLPRNTTSIKIQEMFEIFGDVDNIIINPNHTCYLRMKRSQDARKIVYLLKHNNAGINVDFAP